MVTSNPNANNPNANNSNANNSNANNPNGNNPNGNNPNAINHDVNILDILPHRYPFLLVDGFVSQQGDDFECVKNVTRNEAFFQGHFPQEPVMPGVLIVEALAQASAVGLAVRDKLTPGQIGYFASIDKAKFKRKVVPGDILRLTGTIVMFRRGLCKVETKALVGDDVAAEANLSFVFQR